MTDDPNSVANRNARDEKKAAHLRGIYYARDQSNGFSWTTCNKKIEGSVTAAIRSVCLRGVRGEVA
jgi:hypothetical protein